MKRLLRVPLPLAAALAATAFAFPLSAAMPEKGQFAASGALGLAVPFEGDYNSGFALDASVDYWVDPRYGARATFGWTRIGSDLPGSPHTTDGYVLASGVYNFDVGPVRPYATGGLGFYTIEPAEGGRSGRLGLHVGGGAEWFFRRRIAATGEALVHFVGGVGERKSSFLGLTFGVRYYF